MGGEKITEDEEKSCGKENMSVEPSPVLEKVPAEKSENTATQILETPRSERMRAVRNN